MRFIPTQSAVRSMLTHSLSWPDVVGDLEHAGTWLPVPGYDSRVCVTGDHVQAFCEPGTYEGQDAMIVVGLRGRERPQEPLVRQAARVAPSKPRSRHRGGSGSRWPTSWPELVARIKKTPEHEVQYGGKHLVVLRNGKRVFTLPISASDHRALRNACQQLKVLGIDVRR